MANTSTKIAESVTFNDDQMLIKKTRLALTTNMSVMQTWRC